MKKIFALFILLCCAAALCAQDESWGEPPAEENPENPEEPGNPEKPEESEYSPITLRDKVLLEIDFGFVAAFSPGWTEAPWYNEEREYESEQGARLDSLVSIDIALTDAIRVKSAFLFSIPEKNWLSIKEFYIEYNLLNRVFFQAGLYEIAWGISRFYPFANLPARIPYSNLAGDSYIARVTIPIGIGGLELLALTRPEYADNVTSPSFKEMAYGAKYNLAFEKADIDAGFLYYREMPLRFFVSVKTTLGNTELYTEGTAAVPYKTWDKAFFSGNIGFVRDFFKEKLTLAGEIFYNGESNSYWWRSKTDVLYEDSVDLYKGFNGALAFIIRPGVIGMRIFSQCLYTYEENSFWLIPGISVKPGDLFTISLSAPMALGSRRDVGDESNYYRKNTDNHRPYRPFTIVLGITFNRKLRFAL